MDSGAVSCKKVARSCLGVRIQLSFLADNVGLRRGGAASGNGSVTGFDWTDDESSRRFGWLYQSTNTESWRELKYNKLHVNFRIFLLLLLHSKYALRESETQS